MRAVNPPHPDSEIIDRMGGPGRVGDLCEVSSQAVSQWRKTGIPKARRQYLALVRPEAFVPEPATQQLASVSEELR